MIRIILIALLSTLSTTATVFGQLNEFGVKLGAQSAGVYSDPAVDERVIGFSAYGFIDIQLGNRFFSTVDVGFTRRGFRNVQHETNEAGEVMQRVEATSGLSYVSLTPLINIEAFRNRQNFYFGIGPRFDLLVSRSAGEYEFTNSTFREEEVDEFDEFVFGAAITAGVKNISLMEFKLRVEAKYEVDITDSLSDYPREFRNNALMLVMGIGF